MRLVIADDHALVRAGMRVLIEKMSGIEVVGEATDGHEAIELVARTHPALVLMNISMPGFNGLDATARLTKDHPRTRVLIVSMHADEEYVRRAFAVGASGYLLKSADKNEMELAICAVCRGDVWISPSVSKTVVAALQRGEEPADPFELLTPRQREILQLVAEGLSSKEIADQLGLSTKTVESHRAQLMKRTGVHSLPGLVRYAIRLGLVSPNA